MATFDLVLLSSSPPTSSGGGAKLHTTPPSNQHRVGMSPNEPELRPSVASPKKTSSSALRSGSRASAVPEGAARRFATAGSLLKTQHFNPELDDDFVRIHAQSPSASLSRPEKAEKQPKKPRKRPTKATATNDGAEPKPKKPRARKPKADKGEDARDARSREAASATSSHFAHPAVVDTIESPAKTRPSKPRKPRAKKNMGEHGGNEPIRKTAKVTKSKVSTSSAAKAQRMTTDTISDHFQSHASNSNFVDSAIGIEDGTIWDVPASPRGEESSPLKDRHPDMVPAALDLEEAVTRRKDWTPVKDTGPHQAFTDSASEENNTSALETQKDGFTSMLSSFSFTHVETTANSTSKSAPPDGVNLMKKRRVELIDVPGNHNTSRSTSPEKSKAPKKKARTITDFVTGQYAPQAALVNPSPGTSNFFEPRTTTTKVPLNDVSNEPLNKATKRPQQKRSSSKQPKKGDGSKSVKTSAKGAANPKMVADKLLSPASAVLKMSKQDVLFGTSSQLALEESPTMIREIQRAIRESEQDSECSHSVHLSPGARSRTRMMQRLGNARGRRGLWGASARDEAGQLLESQESIYFPEPDRTQDLPLLMDGTPAESGSAITDANGHQPYPIQISSDLPTPPPTRREDTADIATNQALHDESFDDIDRYQPPPPSNQSAESSFLDIDDFAPSSQPPPASYSIPSPNAVSQLRAISSTTTTSTGSPKRPRGRPPKSHAAIAPSTPPKQKSRFADVDEILDSEDDEALSPTPPRTAGFPNSPPLPLAPVQPPVQSKSQKTKPGADADTEIVHIHKVPASKLEWPNIKDSIFRLITSHVHSIPPTTNPQKPSWHEKILLYDPIILEDFTAYLSANTNIHTYKRATQRQIKAWNKAQRNTGGDVLSVDEGGDGVLVVERELETWMVQAWCQEMSVCCVYRERMGRGGARKGLY